MSNPLTPVSEKEFQKQVIELAHAFGWKIAHFRTAMNARGHYQTPVGADGAGWPDLVLVHPEWKLILFRELKTEKGKLAEHQRIWGEWLVAADQDWAVWRPSDLPIIATALSGGRATSIR